LSRRWRRSGRKAAPDWTIRPLCRGGGGTASDLWMQILADAAGVPVHRSASKEASSLGAAMAAARDAAGSGALPRPSAPWRPYRRTLRSRAEGEGGLRENWARYTQDYWPALSSWEQKLARLSSSDCKLQSKTGRRSRCHLTFSFPVLCPAICLGLWSYGHVGAQKSSCIVELLRDTTLGVVIKKRIEVRTSRGVTGHDQDPS